MDGWFSNVENKMIQLDKETSRNVKISANGYR